MEDKKLKEEKLPMLGIFWALLLFEVLLLGVYSLQFSNGISNSQEAWGQLGDFIGGIANPFLTSVSILCIIYNINLTSKQNQEQRKQFEKDEVARTIEGELVKKEKDTNDFLKLIEMIEQDMKTIDEKIQSIGDISQTRDIFTNTFINGTNWLVYTNNVYNIFCSTFIDYRKKYGNSYLVKYIYSKYQNRVSLLRMRGVLQTSDFVEEFQNLVLES